MKRTRDDAVAVTIRWSSHDEHRCRMKAYGQRPVRRAAGLGSYVAAAAVLIAACSASTGARPRASTTAGTTSPPAHVSAASTVATSSGVALNALPLTPISITATDTDGTTLNLQFKISSLVPASDPRVATEFANLGAQEPCTPDTSRDAVAIGTLTITNLTPSFSFEPSIIFTPTDNMELGFAYSDGPACQTLESGNGFSTTPTLTGTTWGPVAFEYVAEGVYSPADPQGDFGAFDTTSFGIQSITPAGVYPGDSGWEQLTLSSSSPKAVVDNQSGYTATIALSH